MYKEEALDHCVFLTANQGIITEFFQKEENAKADQDGPHGTMNLRGETGGPEIFSGSVYSASCSIFYRGVLKGLSGMSNIESYGSNMKVRTI